MAKADVMAGRAYVSLFVKNETTAALAKAKKELQSFGKSMMAVGAGVSAIGTGIVGTFGLMVKRFSDAGDALDKMSGRTGVAAAALSELGFAAEQSGGSIEDVESAIKTLQKRLSAGGSLLAAGGPVGDVLNEIGLSLEYIQSIKPERQFETVAAAIAGVEDPSKRAAVAMKLLGGSGRQLLPMLGSIKELRAEARELGLSPSPESIKNAADINDAFNRVRRVVEALKYEIGDAVAPAFMKVADATTRVVVTVRKYISENKPLIVTALKVGAVLAAVGTAIIAAGAAIYGAGVVIGGFLTALSAIASVGTMVAAVFSAIGVTFGLLLTPLGAVVGALIAAGAAWATMTTAGRDAVSGLRQIVTGAFGAISETASSTIGGILDALRSGDLELAGRVAMTGLQLAFAQTLDAIHALFGETWGTLAEELLTGDFAGAWSTLGAAILDTLANVAGGMVSLFTGAADAVLAKWQQVVNGISDLILEAASGGGALGWAFEQISGVNMQQEVERGRAIEQQRRARGMAADVGGGRAEDPFIAGLRERVKALGEAMNEQMAESIDATGSALESRTGGRAKAVSESVRKLQEELQKLRADAAKQTSAMSSVRSAAAGGDDGLPEVVSGGASVASFSLAALAATATRSFEQKQLSALSKLTEQGEDDIEMMGELVSTVKGWSLHHA
jgi:hypothetical protein